MTLTYPQYLRKAAGLDDDDYRMSHRPADRDGMPIHDLTVNLPEDVYTHPHYYSDMTEPTTQEAHSVLRRVRNRPDAKVRVYRSLPAEHAHKGIQPGDWVTTSREYAKNHGKHPTDPKHDWPVVRATVKARDLYTDGDDLREYGYTGDKAPTTYVAYQGGQHQRITQRADGSIGMVKHRPKSPVADYTVTSDPGQFEDLHAGRGGVTATAPDGTHAGHLRWDEDGIFSEHVEPEHEHVGDHLRNKMRGMLRGTPFLKFDPPKNIRIKKQSAGHPGETVYRAVHPEEVHHGIRPGDTVTMHLEHATDQAKQHGTDRPYAARRWGEPPVMSAKIPLQHLRRNEDHPLEFTYHGPDTVHYDNVAREGGGGQILRAPSGHFDNKPVSRYAIGNFGTHPEQGHPEGHGGIALTAPDGTDAGHLRWGPDGVTAEHVSQEHSHLQGRLRNLMRRELRRTPGLGFTPPGPGPAEPRRSPEDDHFEPKPPPEGQHATYRGLYLGSMTKATWHKPSPEHGIGHTTYEDLDPNNDQHVLSKIRQLRPEQQDNPMKEKWGIYGTHWTTDHRVAKRFALDVDHGQWAAVRHSGVPSWGVVLEAHSPQEPKPALLRGYGESEVEGAERRHITKVIAHLHHYDPDRLESKDTYVRSFEVPREHWKNGSLLAVRSNDKPGGWW